MRWFRFISLRHQIILLVLAFTLAVGLGNTLRTHLALDALAQEQFERRSVATATGLAAQAAEPLLTNDLFGLYDLVNSALIGTPDVRYIMVLDAAGEVRAHTFGPGIPRGLVEANEVSAGQPWHLRQLQTEEGPIVDVAAPLLEGEAGTLRLGMSEQAVRAAVDRHTLQLLALTVLSLVPVLTFSYILGRALTRPLLRLVDVTRAIGGGDLSRRAPVDGRDEVAQLSVAFNAMTETLAQSQQALEVSNRALQERNEELAALYAIATATAYAEPVGGLVEAALDKVIEVLDLRAGWVLLENDSAGLSLRAARGLPSSLSQEWAQAPPTECLPDDLQALQEATMAHQGKACPRLSQENTEGETLCHTAVPLRSRTHVWGIMHLACPYPGCFSTRSLGLLTAIGQQVGMAIENARLAEHQRRQAFRRRLLDQVLVAQEEERKRIARELHDELAQSLTVLIRDLEGMSGRTAQDQAPLGERMHATRSLALRILEQTRRLIVDLRPTVLDDLGLVPAIRRYAQHHLEAAHIQLHMEIAGQTRRLPAALETAVFRIAQEAISNVVRHAQARQVELRLAFGPASLTLTVRDDGRGFDPEVVLEGASSTRCMGLLGMRERTELLSGHLDIHSRPAEGTIVQVEIPLEEHEPDPRFAGG